MLMRQIGNYSLINLKAKFALKLNSKLLVGNNYAFSHAQPGTFGRLGGHAVALVKEDFKHVIDNA